MRVRDLSRHYSIALVLCLLACLIAACAAPAATTPVSPTPAAQPTTAPQPTAALPSATVVQPTVAPEPTIAPAAEPTASSQPAAKQELIVGYGADPFGLETTRKRLGMYPLNATICETLVRMTPDYQIVPALATKWEYRGDNTFRFTLRPGVKFHDGSPLTAEAVKYSLDRTVKVKIQNVAISTDSVKIVDGLTVDVRTTRPNLRLVEQLVHPTYAILSPGSDPSVQPVCTGPFKFVEYVKQDHLTVVRNDDYWGEKAKLDKLTFRFIPDDNTRGLALQAGEVDAIFNVNRGLVAGLKSSPGIKIVSSDPGAVIPINLTTHGRPPYDLLKDPVIRRAVALSLDRKTFVDRILEGYGAVVDTVNPPAILGDYAAQVKGVAYDTAEAARSLDAAGWQAGADKVRAKDGRRLTLSLIAQPGNIDATMAQFVQAQLAEVGIEVKIEQVDDATYEKRSTRGEYDMDMWMPSQNDANPAFLLSNRWDANSSVEMIKYIPPSAEVSALVQKALAAGDHAQVQEYSAAAMHQLVDQEITLVPLAGVSRVFALKDSVQGFVPHPAGTHQWWDTVWLAR